MGQNEWVGPEDSRWEVVAKYSTNQESDTTRRMPVPGGWLYQTVLGAVYTVAQVSGDKFAQNPEIRKVINTVFVADPSAPHVQGGGTFGSS